MNFFAGSMADLVPAVIQNTRDLKNIYNKTMLRTAGRHCCLWCHIKSSDLKIPLSDRGRSPDRTFQNLKSDNHKFLQAF